MREPAIFWWPGTIKPGVVAGIGSELDLLPTFASVSGGTPPADRPLDGVDLSPTLKRAAPSPRQTLFYYATTGGYPAPLVAVRRGSFKLHLRVPSDAAGQRGAAPAQGRGGAAAAQPEAAPPAVELYNLDEDPSEKFNLAQSRPDIVDQLRRIAEDHLKTVVPGPNQLGRAQAQGRGGRPLRDQ
jgi:arylsulfatase A-like enzyme